LKDIRHIATSFHGTRIALAEFESRVQVFDLTEFEPVSEFDTILDFGGNRLAISGDGQYCICGSWVRHGIIGYDANTGKQLWQRKDLKKVQNIQLVPSNGNLIFTQFDKGISRFINITDGSDEGDLKGVLGYYENPYRQCAILDTHTGLKIVEHLTFEPKSKVKRQSFATLDIANGRSSILFSESGGPLSCYDLDSAQLIWQHVLDEHGHYLRLTYNEELDKFLGVCWPFATGGNKRLRYFKPHDGSMIDEVDLGAPVETEFVQGGQFLVTSDMDIINVKTKEKRNWA
jgi:WD40 repeat protein